MELAILDQREVLGKQFRVYGTVENPLFLAKDVAEYIEHSSITMMLKTIDEDEKIKIRPKQCLGLLTTNNEYWFLTEDGLYEVLMQSRKPIAKAFKKQVKGILKALRLNRMELVNKTNDITVDNKIDEIMDVVKNLVDTVNSLSYQNAELMNKNNELVDKILCTNVIKTNEERNDIVEVKEIEDEIEVEINNFNKSNMKIQDFCDYLNSKEVINRKIGVQIINQLLRDNNIYDKLNNPIKGCQYFIKQDSRYLINKNGMIMLYKLIKEQVTHKYKVRR